VCGESKAKFNPHLRKAASITSNIEKTMDNNIYKFGSEVFFNAYLNTFQVVLGQV
jgi:hypothetical protein